MRLLSLFAVLALSYPAIGQPTGEEMVLPLGVALVRVRASAGSAFEADVEATCQGNLCAVALVRFVPADGTFSYAVVEGLWANYELVVKSPAVDFEYALTRQEYQIH